MVSLGIAIVMLLTAIPVSAATITEKAAQTWAGSAGDTKVHGVFAYDVDGDSTTEIVTVGESYTGNKTEAQLGIWTWDSDTNITLEILYNWTEAPNATNTRAYDVYVADLDQSGNADIVVVGTTGNETNGDFLIRVFHWNGTGLSSVGPPAVNAPAEIYYAVHAADLVGDSDMEIIAAGSTGADDVACIWIWSYGPGLGVVDHTEWGDGQDEDAIAYSVYAKDVDADSTVEIVTAGYFTNASLPTRAGEMRVWNYTNSQFGLEYNDIYRRHNNDQEYYGTFSDDFDNDDDEEIVVCGYSTETGIPSNIDWAYMLVYELEVGGWSREKDIKWKFVSGRESYCSSVYGTNMNADGLIELVTGDWGDDGTRDNGRVGVFKYEVVGGVSSLSTLDLQSWYTQGDTAVYGVYALDLGGDSDPEIISGGKAYDTLNSRSIGEMKIFEFS